MRRGMSKPGTFVFLVAIFGVYFTALARFSRVDGSPALVERVFLDTTLFWPIIHAEYPFFEVMR